MSRLDWIVLLFTLAAIIVYGTYKGRGQKGAESYLLADRNMPWYIVLLGIMATQASAITFISAPGQAYTDGMRFVQYYFGLPIAMVVICITFIPIFQKLNVFTAYEYLERRFDRKTRLLTALLFLLSRGVSTGISIYAPSIILSSIMGWNIYFTNVIMGGLLLIYTYSGGAKAIAHTQKLQFLIILGAMGIAACLIVHQLPKGVSVGDALYVAGKAGKLNVITTGFDWKDKYNIWSGIIGGFFLALSYFGTDQSQVGRYITAKDTRAGRNGLLLNGLVKIPMQFAILLIGALLFAFYSFRPAPVYFNDSSYESFRKSNPEKASQLEKQYEELHSQYEQQALQISAQRKNGVISSNSSVAAFQQTLKQIDALRDTVRQAIAVHQPNGDGNDTNYIFLYFVRNTLPQGLVGLLFAVIFLASWGSISAALHSLAASSLIDIHFPASGSKMSDKRQLFFSRLHILLWTIFCIGVAMFATRMGSLIEAVNVLGSLFYGTILGIFLVAFYMKAASGSRVFYAAIVSEVLVIVIYKLDIISFLWLNVIGTLLVVVLSLPVTNRKKADSLALKE